MTPSPRVGQEGDLDSKVVTGGLRGDTALAPPPPCAPSCGHPVLPAGQGGKYEVIVFSFQNNRFRYSPGVEVVVPGSLCVWWGGACPPPG